MFPLALDCDTVPDIPLPTLAIYGGAIVLLQMFWFTTLTVFFTNAAIRGELLGIAVSIRRST